MTSKSLLLQDSLLLHLVLCKAEDIPAVSGLVADHMFREKDDGAIMRFLAGHQASAWMRQDGLKLDRTLLPAWGEQKLSCDGVPGSLPASCTQQAPAQSWHAFHCVKSILEGEQHSNILHLPPGLHFVGLSGGVQEHCCYFKQAAAVGREPVGICFFQATGICNGVVTPLLC